jgi:hypothetical protein
LQFVSGISRQVYGFIKGGVRVHGCRNNNRLACPVHAARPDLVIAVYRAIIETNYPKQDFEAIQARTAQLMLDDNCPACKVLDEEETDILDRSAQTGRYYAEAAKQYIELLFGTQDA